MNNNPRLYLWLALLVVLYLNYQTWQRDFPPQPAAATAVQSQNEPSKQQSSLANSIPQAQQPQAGAATQTTQTTTTSASPPAAAAAGIPAVAPAAAKDAPLVHVHTDVYDIDISTLGGTLQQVQLLKYAQIKGQAARVQLENDASPQTVYLLQSGLTGPGSSPYPDHAALFTAAQQTYELDGSQQLRVPLTWSSNGVTVTKTFVFTKGSYGIGLEYTIRNQGAAAWQAQPYAQLYRDDPRTKSSYFNPNSYAYHGPAVWDGKYERLDPAKADNQHFARTATDGFIAATQNDFVSAVVMPQGAPYRFTLEVSGPEYLLAAVGPQQTVAPGTTATIDQTLFVGPMLHAQLKKITPNLDYVVGYGLLTVVAGPLFWLLSKVHALTGNWGVAIILVTFLLKLALYPLSEASGRSMAKMKVLGPRIKNIQETYKDDKEKLGRAMMEIYKREKVNPVSGCLPMVIQLPVFIAFYWVLLYSAEMRQAPFMFWIQDLSSRDPYFILPAIMAIAMFVQYKVNPTSPDPAQAKVMMVMPIVMSAMFAFFPAGLVLYYATNTILGLAQQWNINRRLGVGSTASGS
jgi:YidC/Oxa1 family membrane protein insertase